MHRLNRWLAVLAASAAMGAMCEAAWAQGVAAPAASPPASLSPAAADTPQVASFGVAYTVPKDWTVSSGPGWVDVRPPEGDSDFVIVDAGEAKDGPDAAAKAWALFRPGGMSRKILLTPTMPPREFWDGGTQVAYDVSPNEHRAVTAIASRKGTRWTVVLVDANQATVEKRTAGAALLIGPRSSRASLRPASACR